MAPMRKTPILKATTTIPFRVAVSPRRVYIATQERRRNRTSILDPYTALIGPGYCETRESMVSSVTPSTVACATKVLSKGSL